MAGTLGDTEGHCKHRRGLTLSPPGGRVPISHTRCCGFLVASPPASRVNSNPAGMFSVSFTFWIGTRPSFDTVTRTGIVCPTTACFGASVRTFSFGALIRVFTCWPCSKLT